VGVPVIADVWKLAVRVSQAQGGISELKLNPRQNPTVDKWGLVRINDKIVIPALNGWEICKSVLQNIDPTNFEW
jgi:hypothetical protein